MRVIFIINSISAQRCIKRIEEFIAHGFEVEAYGFSRNMGLYSQPKHFSLEIIGEYSNSLPFKDRLPILGKGINYIVQKYKNKGDIVFYLFQLDVALTFRLLFPNGKYFYEESDLMHTYIKNSFVRKALEYLDRKIIRNSLLSVFTSEGFLYYHYGSNNRPKNVWLIANRLNTTIEDVPKIKKKPFNSSKLKIGFVGFPRYKSVVNFIKVFCSCFSNFEFHLYGEIMEKYKNDFAGLQQYPNCFFHGAFLNPTDLPEIYSNIDVVLATYDVEYENVRYAEPNKIYEAIYFETPIIVSAGTFLENKVKRLNIGYSVNPLDKHSVVQLVDEITADSIEDKIRCCKKIAKEDCLNINELFFKKVNSLIF